ncbi:MAG TPA: hypothetical protein DIC25_05210 [Weissella cibaria]|nr:hypothetical protein [Weissella cibaria]HCU09742.1 hypothetical protein [Weissella cibaria]
MLSEDNCKCNLFIIN